MPAISYAKALWLQHDPSVKVGNIKLYGRWTEGSWQFSLRIPAVDKYFCALQCMVDLFKDKLNVTIV